MATTNINPNYQIFEDELQNHPLIKDKIQEKINKRKFSTPITISKEKHSVEQATKVNEYDNLVANFPNNKIPPNFKELWQSLNNRPNITQEEYNTLKNNQGKLPEGLPTNWQEQLNSIETLNNKIKQLESDKVSLQNQIAQLSSTNQISPDELKLLLKDNWKELWNHVELLTKLLKRAVITSNPNLSSEGSSSSSEKPKESIQ